MKGVSRHRSTLESMKRDNKAINALVYQLLWEPDHLDLPIPDMVSSPDHRNSTRSSTSILRDFMDDR